MSDLPSLGAEFFIQAGASVAERILAATGDRALVDAALRRAAQQATYLLNPSTASAARSAP